MTNLSSSLSLCLYINSSYLIHSQHFVSNLQIDHIIHYKFLIMRQRNSSKSSISTSIDETKDEGEVQLPNRPASVMLALIGVIMYGAWSVFRYQYGVLPLPLTAEQAGKGGFSEFEAMEHVKALAGFGPHPVGFPALDGAIKYVADAAKKIKSTSHLEVDVEVEEFYVKNGVNRLKGGRFFGKSLIYADLNHIIIRISPKDAPDAKDNSILVSSHIDTVFTTGGAGDCSSCIAVMLELARGVSQWARGFKSSVIFLFNIGEEEGLNGAHSFITQHPWSETVRTAVDLEAMGIGGKSSIFQTGPNPWAIEIFASVAKYPSGNIFVQDLFSSGLVNSATDFQVYMEVAGLSGLDFAYSDKTAVYHTKNDKVELLKPGSFQHLGDNMLAFLCEAASSPALSKGDTHEVEENADQSAIYFDILGSYMVVYRQHFANMLHNSVLMPSVLIWIVFLVKGGLSAALSLALSCLSVILMWVLSLSFSVVVAFILPSISSAAVPFIASPWLVIGLFGFPSLLGAFAGQHLGFLLLKKYLCHIYAKEENAILPSSQLYLAKLEAERWLFKSGTIQWLFVLMLTHYYKLGSSYIPLVWLVTPLFSYGLLEALRLPKPLKFATLLIALSVPIVVTAGVIIRIIGVNIGTAVRYDSNPGSSAEWMGNVIVAVLIAAFVCLTMVFLLSYLHISGAKRSIVFMSGALFVLSLAAIWSGTIPSFTEETARAVNVVHVVDTRNGKEDLSSYVSFFSSTPGNLDREAQQIGEGFQCGRQKPIDFVTFSVQYGCWTNDTENGWSQSDIPEMEVKSDERVDERTTGISIDTKVSIRWALAINTDLIADFEVRATGDLQNLISFGDKDTKNGWHIIQFSGGRNAPTKFDLSLLWHKNSTDSSKRAGEEGEKYLLKLRTDMEKITPLTERVLMKLPSWCALFGKSTSPFSLAFLTGIPVDF